MVALGKTLATALLAPVTLSGYSGADAWGAPLYTSGATLSGFVEYRRDRRYFSVDSVGQSEADATGSVQLLEQLPWQPSTLDWIKLPDGTTPAIVRVEAAADPTGKPYAPKIYFKG